jgi:uncharacterized protein (DUF983 family)
MLKAGMNSEPGRSLRFAILTGLKGDCPRCGQAPLFSGLLTLAPRCKNCSLDYGFADSGDGPAVFVSFIGGLLVLGAAVWVELLYEPPLWVHILVFFPLTFLVCLALLRPTKGLLIALQFHYKAEEGRLQK